MQTFYPELRSRPAWPREPSQVEGGAPSRSWSAIAGWTGRSPRGRRRGPPGRAGAHLESLRSCRLNRGAPPRRRNRARDGQLARGLPGEGCKRSAVRAFPAVQARGSPGCFPSAHHGARFPRHWPPPRPLCRPGPPRPPRPPRPPPRPPPCLSLPAAAIFS